MKYLHFGLAAALSTLCLSIPPLGAEETSSPETLYFEFANRAVTRDSGEIELTLNQTFESQGQVFKAAVSFVDESAFNRFLDLKLESLALTDFDAVVSLDAESKETLTHDPGSSLLEVGRQASSTLCGDVVARGLKQVAEDLWIGVSLRAAKRFDNEVLLDYFNECDTFAWGGCGDRCVNVSRVDSIVSVRIGRCVTDPSPVWWYPDGCRCI